MYALANVQRNRSVIRYRAWPSQMSPSSHIRHVRARPKQTNRKQIGFAVGGRALPDHRLDSLIRPRARITRYILCLLMSSRRGHLVSWNSNFAIIIICSCLARVHVSVYARAVFRLIMGVFTTNMA